MLLVAEQEVPSHLYSGQKDQKTTSNEEYDRKSKREVQFDISSGYSEKNRDLNPRAVAPAVRLSVYSGARNFTLSATVRPHFAQDLNG